MEPFQQTIRTYFGKLGLEPEIADIYVALHNHGPQSISGLSRTAKVERTRIYRLIDQLLASNLVELEAHNKRGIIKAAPIANLRILINQRQEALKNLADELELVEQSLARNSLSSPAVHIQTYNGNQAVQMLLADLFASGEATIIGYADRPLTTLAGSTGMRPPQNLQLLVGRADTQTPGASCRIVGSNDLVIDHCCLVSDNQIAYIYQAGQDTYGVSLTNRQSAASLRQMLESMWHRSSALGTES